MSDKFTRRQAVGGGILVTLSSLATILIQRLIPEPQMVPLADMIQMNATYFDLMETQRQEHLKDLRECSCR